MPFIYEKPVRKGVTFYHVITPFDVVFWALWHTLRFIAKCIGWIFKAAWMGVICLYSLARFRQLRGGYKDYGDF